MKWQKRVGAALFTMILAITDMTVLAIEPIPTPTGEEALILSEMEQAEEDVAEGVIASGKDGNITWVIDADGKLTVEGTGDLTPRSFDSSDFAWRPYSAQITSAEINVMGMTDASYLFYRCSNMISINLDNFDTENVTDMRGMFSGCSNLASLDVSGFNTRNVTDMGAMFMDCGGLRSLDMHNFDTEKVINMGLMFENCNKLKSLDVSSFNTGNVTDMVGMFCGCTALTSLDLSGFDTKNVTDMRSMFNGCINLTSLEMSNFVTRKVTNMSLMFSGCSMESLDVSGFDTSNVTDMLFMFAGCSNLKSLDVSGFVTSNVTTMERTFAGCSNLKSLDISGFDIANVTNMQYIFEGCVNLGKIYAPYNVNTVALLPSVPGATWHLTDMTEVTELPQGLDYSVTVIRSDMLEEPIPTPEPILTPTPEPIPTSTPVPEPVPTSTPTPVPSPVAPSPSGSVQKVQDFVFRMYTVALGRNAEEAGLKDWTNRLITHEVDGAGIANGFIMSNEFKNRNLSNEDYVDTLYRTFFNREADQGGRATWLAELVEGKSRGYVLAGFVNSVEFDNLCDTYGIARGTMREDGSPVNPGIRGFVERCYTKVLGREGEKAGVEDWTGRIATGVMSAEDVAKSFFFSDEYTNKQTDNETFVETLYQTFMDRASDPAGKSDWVGRLGAGIVREEVLEGFSRSEEFAAILQEYGL